MVRRLGVIMVDTVLERSCHQNPFQRLITDDAMMLLTGFAAVNITQRLGVVYLP